MTKDTIPRALKQQQALLQQLEPLSLRLERLARQRPIELTVPNPTRELERALHGAVGGSTSQGRTGHQECPAVAAGEHTAPWCRTRQTIPPPQTVEFPKLLQSIEMDAASAFLARHQKVEASLRETMKAMSTPWLNMQHTIRSLTGIAGLNELGQIVQRASTLEVAPAKHLRSLLGDWRKKIDWPVESSPTPSHVQEFYLDLGLEPALTEFPAEAFHEALSIAGIKGYSPPLTHPHKRADDSDEDEEEARFERNNTAHDHLQRFESRMRQFISDEMERTFGENWGRRGHSVQNRQSMEGEAEHRTRQG